MCGADGRRLSDFDRIAADELLDDFMSCNGHGCPPGNLSRALLDLSEIGIVAGSEIGAQTIGAARYERNLEYRHDGCPSNSQSRPRFSWRRDAVQTPFSGRVIRCQIGRAHV